MGHRLFQNLSFAPRPQSPEQERTEPRLLPADPPLPFRRPAQPDPGSLPAARDNARPSSITPIIGVPDLQPALAIKPEPSSLRPIVFAGWVLFAVAGVGSAAFLLLANLGKEPIGTASAVNPSPSPPSPIAQTAPPVSINAPKPHPTESTAAPGSAKPPRRPAVNDPALQSPSGLPLAEPASTINPPRSAAIAREKQPSHTTTAVGPSVVDQNAAAAAEVLPDRPPVSAPEGAHRASRAHPVERRAHLRAAHETRALSAEPRPNRVSASQPARRAPRVSGSAASQQVNQAAAFDELLTHLTGSGKPADPSPGQSLTPPPAWAPDPFAPRPTVGSSGQ